MSIIRVIADYAELNMLIRECKGEPKRILHDGVEYGIYQEFGFTHYISGAQVPAQPFMTPALEAIRPAFEKGWGQLANLTQADTFVEKCARDAQNVAKQNAPVDTGALKNSIDVSRAEDMPELADVHARVE